MSRQEMTSELHHQLIESGEVERVKNLIKDGVDVKIKRSGGGWETGKIVDMGGMGSLVKVKWQDEATGKWYSKTVDLTTYLGWEKEASSGQQD